MDINTIILWILMGCMVLGALDRAVGNKFGLGEQFEEGMNAFGPLALAMIGVMSISPVLAKLLNPLVGPVYRLIGADPAMFAGTLLACDMGGWPLAQAMTDNPQAAQLSGLVLGSMFGVTIVFTIPVALGLIDKSDRGYLARGVLAGICTVPIGFFVSGVVAGFPLQMVLINLVPIVVAALLIALGLWRFPDAMATGFEWFGKFLVAIISIGLAVATLEFVLKIKIMPEGWELIPVSEGITVVGGICLVLLGAFPAVHLIITLAGKPLAKAGALLGMNETAAGGMVATLANSIPMFQMMKDMDVRGKVLNSAFAVSAAFAFGDHLGFVAGASRDMIFPVVVGKLAAGITAIPLALLLFGKTLPKASGAPAPAATTEGEGA